MIWYRFNELYKPIPDNQSGFKTNFVFFFDKIK